MSVQSRLKLLELHVKPGAEPMVHYIHRNEDDTETISELIPLQDWEAGQASGLYPTEGLITIQVDKGENE